MSPRQKVLRINPKTDEKVEFESLDDADQNTVSINPRSIGRKVGKPNIHKALDNPKLKVGGYIWKRVETVREKAILEEGEEWRLYPLLPESGVFVSNFGRCIHEESEVHLDNDGGFSRVRIPGGRSERLAIVVAETFLELPQWYESTNRQDLRVNFIDSNTQNCALSNLEWMTRANRQKVLRKENVDFEVGLECNGKLVWKFESLRNAMQLFDLNLPTIANFKSRGSTPINSMYSIVDLNGRFIKLDYSLKSEIIEKVRNEQIVDQSPLQHDLIICSGCSEKKEWTIANFANDGGAKLRSTCRYCRNHQYLCVNCGIEQVWQKGNFCFTCHVGLGKYHKYEEEMSIFLKKKDIHWSYRDQVLPCATKGAMKRPDFALVEKEYVIDIEVDENYHRYYNILCELKRIEQLHETCRLSMCLIRFNPNVESKAKISNYKALEKVLAEIFDTNSDKSTASTHGVYIYFIGYPIERIEKMKIEMEEEVEEFFPFELVNCI